MAEFELYKQGEEMNRRYIQFKERAERCSVRRCLLFILCVLIITAGLSRPSYADTDEEIRSSKVNVTVNSTREELEGTVVNLYRTADFTSDAQYTLSDRYASWLGSSQFDGSTNEKLEAGAQTLASYVSAGTDRPDFTAAVSGEKAVFTSIPTGLYLITFSLPENCGYRAGAILQSLPYKFSGNHYELDINIDMKLEPVELPPESGYKVMKVWKGDSDSVRPASITVTIYKNGKEYSEVELNSSNNWEYSWADATDAEYSVKENSVPKGYTVSITHTQTTFTVVNTYGKKTPPPGGNTPSKGKTIVKTGDDSPLMQWALVLCLSGFVLVAAGVIRLHNRSRENEK